tara:strand:- start:360 stop:548 length:189 start_codon:yes stop_codon:yes gene_type:complete
LPHNGEEMIEVITLLGVIAIGLGLMLQGWFILDLNKRLTYINGLLITSLEEIKTSLSPDKED